MEGPLHYSLKIEESANARRFWSKVIEGPKCWLWHKPIKSRLGPRFAYKGSDIKVARMAFFFSQGFWPYGGAVRTCGNGLCCRPKHLVDLPQAHVPGFLVDTGRHRHGVKPLLEFCKRGHKMEGANLGINAWQRYCRTCFNINRRRHYKLSRESNGLHPNVSLQKLSVSLGRKAVLNAGPSH